MVTSVNKTSAEPSRELREALSEFDDIIESYESLRQKLLSMHSVADSCLNELNKLDRASRNNNYLYSSFLSKTLRISVLSQLLRAIKAQVNKFSFESERSLALKSDMRKNLADADSKNRLGL